MWIYTRIGFFSIVQKNGDGTLTVRSRVRNDLEAFRGLLGEDAPEIIHTTDSDYPYRLIGSQVSVSNVLYTLGMGIDYSNFKSAVADEMGPDRALIYGDVWAMTNAIEAEEGAL